MAHDVTVLGSLNLDVVLAVAAVPGAGETVLASGQRRSPGGKGLNQAVAAARAGATTVMVGAVGDDDAAALLLAAAEADGIDARTVRQEPGPSGTAWVMVQDDGDNAIVVDPGANGRLERLRPAELEAVRDARVLVVQLEVPVPTVLQAAVAARKDGVLVVLNAAPMTALPEELLDLVAVLVVNEHEHRACSEQDLARVGAVVVTLGADGAVVRDAQGEHRVPGVRAEVIDTTGAGDTFTGYLAAGLASGTTLRGACERAVVAGALAVEAAGATASVPTADQVRARSAR